MEGEGADGRPEHPKPRPSYTKQQKINEAACRRVPALASRSGEPSTVQHCIRQAAQSTPK